MRQPEVKVTRSLHERRSWSGRIGDDRVPAIWISLALYEMRRQCRGDIRLALYRVYRVIFAAHNEGQTLDAMKIREQPHRTSRVPFAAYHRRS